MKLKYTGTDESYIARTPKGVIPVIIIPIVVVRKEIFPVVILIFFRSSFTVFP